MVVRGDGKGFDTGVDEEVHEDGLNLGLARFEVVTTDVDLFTTGEVDDTRNEGVLGAAIDEGDLLEDGGEGEDGGGRNLFMAFLDGLEQVVGGVVDARENLKKDVNCGHFDGD